MVFLLGSTGSLKRDNMKQLTETHVAEYGRVFVQTV